MTHYEERLEKDLAHIKEKVADLANSVETALEDASLALFTGDEKRAYAVILGDMPINRASRALDKLCHRFFAVHLPSAGHLRFVSTAMRLNIELERIGDYAVTICRESVQMGHAPSGPIGQQLAHTADEVLNTLKQAVESFNNADADQARRDIERAREVAYSFDRAFENLVNEGEKIGIRELFYYMVIYNKLGRVVAQAKNIGEATVFAVTGQTKAPKSYRVLFLDEDNSILGPMAQAIARRSFPQWGEYTSAGKRAADAMHDNLGLFLAERGVELTNRSPRALDPTADFSDYHAIVSLQGPVKSYLDAVPYQTIALEWEMGEPPASNLAKAEANARLETLYRTLAIQIRDLMETLHGEEE